MNVAVLAGGVGGAKLAFGLQRVLAPNELSVIVNTGDDFQHLGLHIAPDLDTVTYTLAGIANPDTGWGVAGDTFEVLAALERLGGPSWFRLGDRDLATHLQRTALLAQGLRLTDATERICESLGVKSRVLPMTDDSVATKVLTDEGELDFQDYFVRRLCEPGIRQIHFDGVDRARPSDEVMATLRDAGGVVIAPSNPFVSVEPVLALPGIRARIASKPAIAVSPIVGGQALKGPAAKMLAELGSDVSSVGVARRYAGLVGGFVIDHEDLALAEDVSQLGFHVAVTQTVMRSDADREQLARDCLDLLNRVTAVPTPHRC